jgi:hypothetical protein
LKKFIAGLISGIILASSAAAYGAGQEVMALFTSFRFLVNGEERQLDASPILVNGSSYLPVRAISNMLGFEVAYHSDIRTIELKSKLQEEPPAESTSEEVSEIERKNTNNPLKETSITSGTPDTTGTLLLNNLEGETLYTLTSLKKGRLDNLPIVGDTSMYDYIRKFIDASNSPGLGFGYYQGIQEPDRSRISEKGIIFIYDQMDTELRLKDEQFLPLKIEAINQLLYDHSSFVHVSMHNNKPYVFFAGKNASSLMKIIQASYMENTLNTEKQIYTYYKLAQPLSKPTTSVSVIVDLRNPTYNGTALVYIKDHSKQFQQLDFYNQDILMRPDNMIAYYDPQTGEFQETVSWQRRQQAYTASFDQHLKTYEIRPYFSPSQPRSMIHEKVAFIRLTSLLPNLKYLGSEVAVHFMLPDDWIMNAPYKKVGDWHIVPTKEYDNQYITFGNFNIANIQVVNTFIKLALASNLTSMERQQREKFIKMILTHLINKMGEPLTDFQRDFSITIFDEGMQAGGSGGHRSATTIWDPKILAHEVIHWWNGVAGLKTEMNIWHEAATEYLAAKVLRETGYWTAAQASDFFKEKGAAEEQYDYAKNARNVYQGSALAFAKDLDLLIIKESKGTKALEDVFAYYYKTNKEPYDAKKLTVIEFIQLIKSSTGVDASGFFITRYAPTP